MKVFLVAIVLLGFVAHIQADVADPKCWNFHLLSKHPQDLDPAYGNYNWQANGDYSGTHIGPAAIASLDESGGWRLDGTDGSFAGASADMKLLLLADVEMPYKASSLGDVLTLRSAGTLLELQSRAGGPAPGTPEDLNMQTVSNSFEVFGDIAFTVTRKLDGASYDGVFRIENQLISGTAFNGLGFVGQEFVDETLTVWLWGTEDSNQPGDQRGYSFLKNEPANNDPLAIDIVISGEYFECDGTGGAGDPCVAQHTCDPEQCGADCECILNTSINCGKLNIIPGSLGSCIGNVP